MIIWVLLFIVVVIISLVLAARSLRSYRENPAFLLNSYSLFLIQKPQNLTEQILSSLHSQALSERLIISFEKLFKGKRSALVVYLPTELTLELVEPLGLLELEDYTGQINSNYAVFEVGPKINSQVEVNNLDLSPESLILEDHEQLWWQIVTQPTTSDGAAVFQSISRIAITSSNPARIQELSTRLFNILGLANLTKLPRTNTREFITQFRSRSLFGMFSNKREMLSLAPSGMVRLLN